MYLLIDECCGKALLKAAEELGHTAQRTREVVSLGPGAADRDIFELAREAGAVFVTINRADFVDLAAYGREHPGVIVLPSVLGQDLVRLFRMVLPNTERVMDANRSMFVEIDAGGKMKSFQLP